MQTCLSVERLAEEGPAQNKWYDLHSLGDSRILLEAVHAALAADVIVVSVHAADELPLDLYVWVAAWLPRRLSRAGTLTALVGGDQPLHTPFVRTIRYLQAVARKAQLDFVSRKHTPSAVSTAASANRVARSARATASALQDLQGQRYFSYYHGGLNE